MPRPKGIPSYRLHPRSGQARVTIDGKDHYLGPMDSPGSREEYERVISEWLASGRANRHAPPLRPRRSSRHRPRPPLIGS